MTLLEKMDVHRLKENPESKDDCYAHEWKHCGSLLNLLWKVKVTAKKGGVGGSWYTTRVYRCLEKGCNEEGKVFIYFAQCCELKQLNFLAIVLPIPSISYLSGENQLKRSY